MFATVIVKDESGILFFLPRDAMHKRGLCCRPVSVLCPSVMLVYCILNDHFGSVFTNDNDILPPMARRTEFELGNVTLIGNHGCRIGWDNFQ